MENFIAYNPTRIVFGKDGTDKLSELTSDYSNILLVYGGGSIKKNGIFDAVVNGLKGKNIIEFGGVEANPEFDTLMKAVQVVKSEKVDFILAVGGGSVIDGVKFISGASRYEGDPWDVLLRKEGCVFNAAVPFGTVLTLPATGSEANSGAVISRSELKEKRTMGGPLFFPVFSICDPTVVASLPKRQLANGIVDAYMHTLEQYLTYPSGNRLQERHAEGILLTLNEIAHELLEQPSNYELAANMMWCATHALNGNLRAGVPTDWATHMIGHELTALYGIDHARTLAIIAPRLYKNQLENKKDMLVQYGKRVFQLEGNDDEIAKGAIIATENFFNSLGIETRVSNYTEDYSDLVNIVKSRFEERGWVAMGEQQAIGLSDIQEIIEESLI